MAQPQRKTGSSDSSNRAATDNARQVVIPMPLPETSTTAARAGQQRIGDILKRERERRGDELQPIADYLCIRKALLVALEESRYEEFPADAYVVGFLRSYAELLGFDGKEAVNMYRQERAGLRRAPDLVLPTPISEGRAPTAVLMGAAAFAALLIYVLWYTFSSSDRAVVTTPPALPTAIVETTSQPTATDTANAAATNSTTTPATPGALAASPTAAVSSETTVPSTTPSGIALGSAAPAPTATSATTTAPAPTAAATTKSATETAVAQQPAAPSSGEKTGHVIVKAEQSSWVLVSDGQGRTIFDRVMKAGETYAVPGTPGLKLTTGNGAGVTLLVDGTELPPLSNVTSHIVRNVPLDPWALKKWSGQ